MQTTQQNNEARTAIESGFAWDAQDAYLFDIDGTLLRSRDRVHMDSLPATVREVMGIEVCRRRAPICRRRRHSRSARWLLGVPPRVKSAAAAILDAARPTSGSRTGRELILTAAGAKNRFVWRAGDVHAVGQAMGNWAIGQISGGGGLPGAVSVGRAQRTQSPGWVRLHRDEQLVNWR